MNILSVSTAEAGCSLAVMDDHTLVCEEYWASRQTHSKRVVQMIQHLLDSRAGISLSQVDAFVAARGPGSFTGLRIGISVIKGFSCALGKPAFGVSSLDGIAYQYRWASIPVCAMMDARRNEVYCACYSFDAAGCVSKTAEQVVSPRTAAALAKGPALFVGSGAVAYKDLVQNVADHPVFDHDSGGFVSARALVTALQSVEGFSDPVKNALNPGYIRKSDAELQFVKK